MQNENIIRRVGPDKVATGRLLIMTLNGATLSPDEKKADKNHRNINRRVSPSIYIGIFTYK